jgi:DNA-binding SARP family transcriptional activator
MERDRLIRVLGPIDLLTPSGPQSVGSGNCRALLGALVIAAGHSVSIDQLRLVLWGVSPPRSADNSLQTYVSRLRHVLGSEAIVHADHSYRLDATRDQIDALRFEDLLVQATATRSDPPKCQALCREALGLWRGEAFGELTDAEPFRLEVMRLDELRVTTMELALETELALGNHQIAVAELESAVQEHPYRERLWHLLIEALLRDDRRVEALRACQNFRNTLADAGLEPGDQLRSLEGRILRGRPSDPHPHGDTITRVARRPSGRSTPLGPDEA